MYVAGLTDETFTDDFACSLNELRINNFFGFFQMLIIINIYLFYDGVHFSNSFTYTPRNIHLLRPAKGSYLFLSRHLRSRILFGHLEVCFAVLPVPSPRRIAPYPC